MNLEVSYSDEGRKAILISQIDGEFMKSCIYKISKGKLVQTKTIQYAMPESKTICYYVDKKKVTKSYCDQLLSEYRKIGPSEYTMYKYKDVIKSPIIGNHKVFDDSTIKAKKLGTNYIGFACTLEEENGKVSGFRLPYWA